MKSIAYFVLGALFIISCKSDHENSVNLDFSGMDEFWKISSTLTKNAEPAKEDWDKLFNTPGYSTLTQSGF